MRGLIATGAALYELKETARDVTFARPPLCCPLCARVDIWRWKRTHISPRSESAGHLEHSRSEAVRLSSQDLLDVAATIPGQLSGGASRQATWSVAAATDTRRVHGPRMVEPGNRSSAGQPISPRKGVAVAPAASLGHVRPPAGACHRRWPWRRRTRSLGHLQRVPGGGPHRQVRRPISGRPAAPKIPLRVLERSVK